MSLPTQVQALVVGAGPVGLAAAIAFKQRGIEVIIVDAATMNRNGSRAGIVHPRTLEVLETIGMAKSLIDSGIPTKSISFYGKRNRLVDVNMDILKKDTAYPFSVLISQRHVEILLEEKLTETGLSVIRGKAVTGYNYDVDHRNVNVTFEDGSSIRTRYLIGTDGAHSVVRTYSAISFADPYTEISYDSPSPPNTLHIALADVYLTSPLPSTVPPTRFTAHLDSFHFLSPFPSTDPAHPGIMWRLGFGFSSNASGERREIPHEPSKEWLQKRLDERNPWAERIIIEDVLTSSRYRVRAALADTYWKKLGEEGHVLLAGDAAHVHSPVAGQGMNLGICDAVSLAHFVKTHIDAAADKRPVHDCDAIFANYSSQRREIGYRVIELTKGLTTMVNWGVGWRKPVRNFVMRVIGRGLIPGFKTAIAWRVSGLGNRDAF